MLSTQLQTSANKAKKSLQKEPNLAPIWVVIPAAGVGRRMQLEYPKQYEKIQGKTILEHSLSCFIKHSQIEGIVCVFDADDTFCSQLKIDSQPKPIRTTVGGKDRAESVLHGLDYLKEVEALANDSWVMVHDAARPCLSEADIDKLLAIRSTTTLGGLLASPVKDSMKRSVSKGDFEQVKKSESRDNLWCALTPQMFRLAELINALNTCRDQGIEISDESSALEKMGKHPIIVAGSQLNIKVTYPNDLELASLILETISKTEKQ